MNKNKNVQPKSKPNTTSAAAKAARPRRQRRNRGQNRDTGNDPSVSVGVASSKQQRTRNPVIQQRTSRGVRIVHREFLQTVSGSTGFSTLTIPVNPGLPDTFPWLAPQAAQWEQYRFNRLSFEYITRAPTTSTGSVILAPDYDAVDQAPNSEIVLTTFQDAVENSTWQSITSHLDVSAMHSLGPKKFVRTGPVFGSDIKTYDVANFYLGTTGQANTDPIGKLWIDYDIEFFVPQSANLTGTPVPTMTSEFWKDADENLVTGVATPLTFNSLDFNPLAIVVTSGNQFRLPRGAWRIQAHVWIDVTAAAICQLHLAEDGVNNNDVFDTEDVAGLGVDLNLTRVIATNGLHDYAIVATMTSAGTNTAKANRCNLIVSPA